MNPYLKWFNPVVFVGALINILGMALPFIFATQAYLNWLGLPGGGGSVIWMRQAGILLFFISILYIPGGIDPIRYALNAKFAVAGRMTIGLYWFWLVFMEGQTKAFLMFGSLDVIYAAFQWFLLWKLIAAEEHYNSPLHEAA